jgi:hypothetical protein
LQNRTSKGLFRVLPPNVNGDSDQASLPLNASHVAIYIYEWMSFTHTIEQKLWNLSPEQVVIPNVACNMSEIGVFKVVSEGVRVAVLLRWRILKHIMNTTLVWDHWIGISHPISWFREPFIVAACLFFQWMPKSRNMMSIPIKLTYARNMFLLWCGFRHLNKTLLHLLARHCLWRPWHWSRGWSRCGGAPGQHGQHTLAGGIKVRAEREGQGWRSGGRETGLEIGR